MSEITVPRVIISGDRIGVGKSIFSIGLAFALRKRNISVSFCINGIDASQAALLSRLTRRYVGMLDTQILSNKQILNSLTLASSGADIVIIEGQRGLFDGSSPGDLSGSDAELAKILNAPVILICDVRSLENSIAALIKGYSDLIPDVIIEGVCANRLITRDEAYCYDKESYNLALQKYGLRALLAALPENLKPLQALPKSFNQLKQTIAVPFQMFADIGNLIENHLDLDTLVKIASRARRIETNNELGNHYSRRAKIAISEDNCFNICFQDNMNLLKYFGAELVTFSPVADTELPRDISAIYLSGGALDSYCEDINYNKDIKESIRNFVTAGGVVYSEGAGSAYLCSEFEGEEGAFINGVGIIPGKAIKDKFSLRYIDGIIAEDSIFGSTSLTVKGVATNEWRLAKNTGLTFRMRTTIGSISALEDGFSPQTQVFSTFNFQNWMSNPVIAKNFVDAAEVAFR
jgi:cobyrinic acid a,c-diamide synthase